MSSQIIGKKLFVHIGAFISLTIVCLSLWVLYHTLHDIHIADVLRHFRELPKSSIILAFCVTAASYLVVTGYDVLALNHIERPLPYPRAALAGFLASAFGNNVGFALLTGGSVRYRIYSQVGLSALQIAGVTAMCSLTTMLGMGFILALSMLLGRGEIAEAAIHLPLEIKRGTGAMMLILLVTYVTYTAISPITIRTRNWSLKLPSASVTVMQISLATLDLMLIGSLIYVLLPTFTETNFFTFLGIFALAMIAGSISNVPGGLGVFETVLLLGLPHIPPAALLGSILMFRCVYYLAPLTLAALTLAVHEVVLQRPRLARLHVTAMDWLAEFGPQLMALIIVFAGIVLLFSGAIPAADEQVAVLQGFLPLWVLELAHVIGGVAGLGLIILARGLSRRLSSAYHRIVILLGVGMMVSLLKGLDYEETIILGVILVILFSTKREFRHKGSVVDQGFPVEWVSTLMAILAVSVWLGLFSFKQIGYANELWWQFAYEADFSRFLRSSLVVLVLAAGTMLVYLLRSDPVPDVPHAVELDQVRRILKHDPNTRASLALLGDKRFLFSDSGNAFIMYRVRGKSWVALGDPVGPKEEHEALLWTFQALCDRYGGWPVFYLIDGEGVSRYVDLGLSVLKLGDDARVALESFSLGARAQLRQIHARVLEQRIGFEIVNSSQVPPLIPELKRVSDAWLAETKTREKGFSSGVFAPDYVANFPCALLRQETRLVAFAILWASANKEELALDLMRYHPKSPAGVMDYLIAELMLGGRDRGYRWFNLGIAPLSNLATHPLAPLWHRVGKIIYRQSEHFRSVETLRHYEEKFNPVWRPKYLASPGGLNTPRILRDIASLIANTKM